VTVIVAGAWSVQPTGLLKVTVKVSAVSPKESSTMKTEIVFAASPAWKRTVPSADE